MHQLPTTSDSSRAVSAPQHGVARRGGPRHWLMVGAVLALAAVGASSALAADTNAGGNNEASQQRLSEAVRYLASDDLAGRGVGDDGLNAAADYIAAEFSRLGLKTDLFDGQPFQRFSVTVDSKLGPNEQNRLVLVGPPAETGGQPQRIVLDLGSEFNTLAAGGTAKVEAPLVFVGYGITAKEHDYDDYAGLDVKGKVVLMVRKEPQQANPHSVFEGAKNSRHALFNRKIANANEHGAAAVIIVNDGLELKRNGERAEKDFSEAIDELVKARQEFQKIESPMPEQIQKFRTQATELAERIAETGKTLQDEASADQIVSFNGAGRESSHRKLPVFFCTRAAIDPVVKQILGVDLAALEKQIDQGPTPHSQELAGWSVACESNVIVRRAEVKNVVGVLEGEGPLADETIVVGAHYDHLGMGGPGSLAPWTTEIHNGADDNASGTAALLETARRVTARGKPRRRIVFIAFTAEERGLLGSARYVREPRFSLENTVAMVNMDMVGRLDDNKLIVHGTGTATEFDPLVDELGKTYGFQITKKPGGYGPSDHSSFYAKRIPVLHIFTGTHRDYHRPSDDFDKVNFEGLRRITDFVVDTVARIDEAPARPAYQQTKAPPMARGGDRPYFGSIPDFSQEAEGYALMGVSKGGPAEKAGLKAGDIIIKFGDSKISGLEDFDSALRKFKAGDKAPVVVKRGKENVELTVTLDNPR